MEKIVTIIRENNQPTSPNYFNVKNEIDILLNRLKMLNNSNNGIIWKDSTIINLVNVEVDKKLLKLARAGRVPYCNENIGKGYKVVEIGNKLKYIPVYFKESEVLEAIIRH